MKAIIVTEILKTDNPTVFKNYEVGSIAKIKVPKTFKRGEDIILGYEKREDLQLLDGWKEVVTPTITDTQRLGQLIDGGDVFTYEVIDLSQDELDIKVKEDDKEAQRLLRTVVWEGETKNGNYYILTIKDDGKLEAIKID